MIFDLGHCKNDFYWVFNDLKYLIYIFQNNIKYIHSKQDLKIKLQNNFFAAHVDLPSNKLRQSPREIPREMDCSTFLCPSHGIFPLVFEAQAFSKRAPHGHHACPHVVDPCLKDPTTYTTQAITMEALHGQRSPSGLMDNRLNYHLSMIFEP